MRIAPSQNRKLSYGVGILVLLLLIVPYHVWLDRIRYRRDLGEAAIGQVDAGSFMLKLALLGGARGVASNVLWSRAIELQKANDWDRMKATVDLITKLQPHFLAVWTFQSWNLAYNVSVEWDAPEDKYEWIKQGINFIRRGVQANRRSPDLVWDTGWYYYHKLGFADEAVILRQLFRDDVDVAFKTDPTDGAEKDDNFLLGHGWLARSVSLVDSGVGTRLASGMEKDPADYVDAPTQRKGRAGDLHFRSMPAHALIRYASSLEKQSIRGVPPSFGQVASNVWTRARRAWVEFGTYPFEAHSPGKNGEREMVQLDDFTDRARYAKLTENQKYWTDRWCNQTNYPFWKDKASAEMERDGVEARRHFYEGTKALKAADFPLAAREYSEGLKLWDKVLGRHKTYRDDYLNQRDTGLIVRRYVRALQNAGQEPPKNMPFQKLLKIPVDQMNVDPFDAIEVLTTATAAEPARSK